MLSLHTDKSPIAKAIQADLSIRNIEHNTILSSNFKLEADGLVFEDGFTTYMYLNERYPTGYSFTPADHARHKLLFLQLTDILASINFENEDQLIDVVNRLPVGHYDYLLGNRPHPLDGAIAPIVTKINNHNLAAPLLRYKNRLLKALKGSIK